MNTTGIAAWFLTLTMGVISAIAVTEMPTRVLASPRLSLYATPQSEGEINDRNWQNNSKIVGIRKIVNSANAKVRNGTFKTEHRICEEGWFSRLRIARDSKGTVRWYQHYQEGEDSSWDDNYYYDDAGRLRFVLMTSSAINGTREQHRAYFDESGPSHLSRSPAPEGDGIFWPPSRRSQGIGANGSQKGFCGSDTRMQRGKVLRKASHEKELNDIVAVSIKIGLRCWRDVLILSQPKRYLDDR